MPCTRQSGSITCKCKKLQFIYDVSGDRFAPNWHKSDAFTFHRYFGDRFMGVDSIGGHSLPFPIDKLIRH